MDNKVCSKCGTENHSEALVCKVCGNVLNKIEKTEDTEVDITRIKENSVDDIKVEEKEEINNNKGNVIGLISFFVFFIGGVFFPIMIYNYQLPDFLEYVSPVSIIIGIILAIYGNFKYPKSKVSHFAAGTIALFSIIIVAVFALIANACVNSIDEGCNQCNDYSHTSGCE